MNHEEAQELLEDYVDERFARGRDAVTPSV